MVNHSLNQGFVKCFIKDKEDFEKMALTLLYSELGRTFKGICSAKYRQNKLFLGLGRNNCLDLGFSTN